MGVQGLRKFIDSSSCTGSIAVAEGVAGSSDTSTPIQGAVLVDHLLFDMNGLIHHCYKSDHTGPIDTIRAVLEHMERILRNVATPRLALVLAVDGPPHVAKLATQRLRRRKVRHMDVRNGNNFSDLSITVGSPFLLDLEACLERFIAAARKEGWLRCRRATIVGSAVAGEGEHKLAKALHLLSMDPTLYSPASPVVIVGNDIDLVLTCMGATPFVNVGVLSPSTLQLVDVSVILRRWVEGEGSFVKDMSDLASARLDFVFIFLLNGGDHFVGLGDAAVGLWRRYKLLRTSSVKKFRLFNPSGTKFDIPNFAELIGCDASKPINDTVEKDAPLSEDEDEADNGKQKATEAPISTRAQELAELSQKFLHAVMASFGACVRGEIADYREETPDTSFVTINSIRDAVLKMPNSTLTFRRQGAAPLAPLLSFAAVMPTTGHLPLAFQAAASRYPGLAASLDNARHAKEVVTAVLQLWKKVDQTALSEAEQRLVAFGKPVDIDLGHGVDGNGIGAWWETPLLPAKGQEAKLAFSRETPLAFGEICGKMANFSLSVAPTPPAAVAQDNDRSGVVDAGKRHHGRPDLRGLRRRARSHDDGLQQRVRDAFSSRR